MSINLKIQEVQYGSYEPILSHSETKKNPCHDFELWKFLKGFCKYIFPCVISS